jgi:ATP-dependent DNA helicase RecQ
MIAARYLEQLLDTGEVPSWSAGNGLSPQLVRALQRLVDATQDRVAGLDWAVLVRQCLRYLPSQERITLRALDEPRLSLLREVDVSQELDGTLVAQAYRPQWVADLGDHALDLPRAGVAVSDTDIPGEPWLRRVLGKTSWKSEAQRDAAWRALKAPPNSTLLIGLPTGAGKSLVYQCCAAFEPGLTVVVVPTVALGIDQRAAVEQLGCADAWQPLLYTPDEDPESVLDAVRSRHCRLLITSPEAIVAGRLRDLLREHAKHGFLQRLVVDEAHLVESWGADFRVEFQLLGAVLREWRALAPAGIRTLLLSATFAPSTPGMLRELFAGSGVVWDELIVQRLRPEIHYFATPDWVTQEQQQARVREALLRLPRPAILYVTAVQDAEEWGRVLRDDGFERLAVFHGDTQSQRRKAIMDDWRADRLDLVVATSAFGMGVDKADVRAVVHACYPEGLDRFYQEVGRGGRDGHSCTALLVPTRRDERMASSLGPTLIKDPVKVNGRWHAMWQSRSEVRDGEGRPDGRFRIRTEVQPAYRLGNESFSENTRWNKRLLLMMDRAGLLQIESLAYERSPDGGSSVEFAVVSLRVPSMELEASLPERLARLRKDEVETIQRALDGLDGYFKRVAPVCRKLRSHYGEATMRACGSCGFCRTGAEHPMAVTPLLFEANGIATRPAVQVVQAPALSDVRARANVIQSLRQVLQGYRIDRLVTARAYQAQIEALLERADDAAGMPLPYRLDDLSAQCAHGVLPDETILVFHIDAVDLRANVFNTRGRSVAHWLLGGTLEPVPGRWPFMHEYHARAYPGPDGLHQWLYDMDRVSRTSN